MTNPPLISVLYSSGGCIGFLRSAGPRGFTAYTADGALIGAFDSKAAAVTAITPGIVENYSSAAAYSDAPK